MSSQRTNEVTSVVPSAAVDLEVDGLRLPLRRYAPPGRAVRSVLLLHGGNTNSAMYHEPDGGLVKHLVDESCDVWTLDWRASATVMTDLLRRGPLGGSEAAERDLFSLDRVAAAEIPIALRRMREMGVKNKVAVLGFCLGGGALSMAVARGHLEPFDVGNVVLVTMGLFYEVPWNGWIKAEDFIIERLLASAPQYRAVDPLDPSAWPKPLSDAYDHWPERWLTKGDQPVEKLFRRLTFMYGEPYARPRLASKFERGLASGYFGPMHLGLYLHAGQMVRRGYAARFNSLDVIDRTRIGPTSRPVAGHDLLPEHFRNKRVTVVTGAEDALWHRDSIDLMYEWLRNEAIGVAHADARHERERHRKHVLAHYGHLDLFWSEASKRDVYPLLTAALLQPSLNARPPMNRNLTPLSPLSDPSAPNDSPTTPRPDEIRAGQSVLTTGSIDGSTGAALRRKAGAGPDHGRTTRG